MAKSDGIRRRAGRAVLELRNVAPTPPRGMSYSIYVLVTSPGRVTLRQTAFVRSEKGMGD